MEADPRAAKKYRSARALRDVPPAETLRMGFELSEFARRLQEAADRARL